MVVLRARTGTMVPMKGKGKLPWTSAGLLFHLRGVSHLQQCGGSHIPMWTSVTSSLLSFPSFLPDPSLASPMGAFHPPASSFPGQTPPHIVTKLPAGWSFRNQEEARRAAILYPCLCYSFTKQSQAIQSHSSLENQEGGRGAMSEINILFWVQMCQWLLLLIIPGKFLFGKYSTQYLLAVWDNVRRTALCNHQWMQIPADGALVTGLRDRSYSKNLLSETLLQYQRHQY